jgi:hypothetical protein
MARTLLPEHLVNKRDFFGHLFGTNQDTMPEGLPQLSHHAVQIAKDLAAQRPLTIPTHELMHIRSQLIMQSIGQDFNTLKGQHNVLP